MLTPNQLKDYRKRAVTHLLNRVDKSTPMLIDYYLDEALRALLNLPDRPSNQLPYVGWMTPSIAPSVERRITSEAGINLIKEFEGFRAKAYLCPSNVWTIGYGHTATVKPGMTIARKEAVALLEQDLRVFEKTVSNVVKVPLNQNQFDALVSFAYNVGSNAFSNSSLVKFLNRGNYVQGAKELFRWVHGSSGKLKGLVRRRQAEYELFTKL